MYLLFQIVITVVLEEDIFCYMMLSSSHGVGPYLPSFMPYKKMGDPDLFSNMLFLVSEFFISFCRVRKQGGKCFFLTLTKEIDSLPQGRREILEPSWAQLSLSPFLSTPVFSVCLLQWDLSCHGSFEGTEEELLFLPSPCGLPSDYRADVWSWGWQKCWEKAEASAAQLGESWNDSMA